MYTDAWSMPVCVPETLAAIEYLNPPLPPEPDGIPYVGGVPPFGWRLDPRTRMLDADEAEQSVIAAARELHGTGLSLRGISARLAMAGMVSRAGLPFAAAQVARLIALPGPRPQPRRQSKRGRAVSAAFLRATQYGVARERVDPVVVFERDGWRCRICGRPTPRSSMGHSAAADAPTLDHIIPMSRGGPHTYVNVRCACRTCNSAKRQPPALVRS